MSDILLPSPLLGFPQFPQDLDYLPFSTQGSGFEALGLHGIPTDRPPEWNVCAHPTIRLTAVDFCDIQTPRLPETSTSPSNLEANPFAPHQSSNHAYSKLYYAYKELLVEKSTLQTKLDMLK